MTKEEFTLSIIVVFCDKDFHFLNERLKQIEENVKDIEYEIILVDNREINKEKIYLKPNMRLISMGYNSYPFTARLYGIKAAKNNYAWVLDVDDPIGELSYKDVENVEFKSAVLFGFTFKNEIIYDWCKISVLIFPTYIKSDLLKKFFSILNEKMYYAEDLILLEEIKRLLEKTYNIHKVLVFHNTSESAGSFSKPHRTLSDYDEIFIGAKYEFKHTFSDRFNDTDRVKILKDNIFNELKNHPANEQEEVIYKYLKRADADINWFLKIAKAIAKEKEFNWVLPASEKAINRYIQQIPEQSKMLTLSIAIIFCDKDAHFIPGLLNQVKEKVVGIDYEILLYDNRDNKIDEFDFSDNKIKYTDMHGNQMPFAARCRALKEFKKNYLWFIDADDSIEEVSLSFFEGMKYDKDIIFKFNYILKNKIEDEYRVTNIFIPKNEKINYFFQEKASILNRKIYYNDDTIINDFLKENFKFKKIEKVIYKVNTTESAGSYSKPLRTLKDYELLFEGLDVTIKRDINYFKDNALIKVNYILCENFFKEIALHSQEERIKILNLMYKKSKLSRDMFIEICKNAVICDYSYNWLLPTAYAATPQSEH